MGSLLSKEGVKSDPPKEDDGQSTPKSTETNGEPKTSDTDAAENKEDTPKTDEVENAPKEEQESTQHTQEEVKDTTSQENSADPEKPPRKADESKSAEKTWSFKETREFNNTFINSVHEQPSPFGNPPLHADPDTLQHDEIRSKGPSANVYHSVKPSPDDGHPNQNKQSNVGEPGEKETQHEVQTNTRRDDADVKTYQQEPIVSRRTPVDEVQDPEGSQTGSRPKVEITEARAHDLTSYNPSMRAAKRPASFQTRPVSSSFDRNVPLSFVWTTVADGDDIVETRKEPIPSKPRYKQLSILNPRSDTGERQDWHVNKIIEKKKVNPESVLAWTFPSDVQDTAVNRADDSVKRDLQMESEARNRNTSSLARTVPSDAREHSKTESETGPSSGLHRGSEPQRKPPLTFDVWWPTEEGDPSQQSSTSPSFFKRNVEKHVTLYTSEGQGAQKWSTNAADVVKSGLNLNESDETASKAQLAWNATKRKHVEDYLDYLQGIRRPAERESEQSGTYNSGISNEDVSSSRTRAVNETKNDPVPYSKDYLKDGGHPLQSKQRPVKLFKPAMLFFKTAENSTENWTPNINNTATSNEVTKEDITASLKSHQKTYKLSPPPETGTRRYLGQRGRGTDRTWREFQPLGQPGRRRPENSPYQERPTDNTYDMNRDRSAFYQPGSHQAYRSNRLPYEWNGGRSEFNQGAPELVDMESIRREHWQHDEDDGIMST